MSKTRVEILRVVAFVNVPIPDGRRRAPPTSQRFCGPQVPQRGPAHEGSAYLKVLIISPVGSFVKLRYCVRGLLLLRHCGTSRSQTIERPLTCRLLYWQSPENRMRLARFLGDGTSGVKRFSMQQRIWSKQA